MVIFAEQLWVVGDVHGRGTFLNQGLWVDAQSYGLEVFLLEGFGVEMANFQVW